jgi:hypothetical protein
VQVVQPGTLPDATPQLPWFLHTSARTKTKAEAQQMLAAQGLRFTENRGQAADEYGRPRNDVAFYGSTRDAKIFFTKQGINYAFDAAASPALFDDMGNRRSVGDDAPMKYQLMQMQLIGSNSDVKIVGEQQMQGVCNYIKGKKEEWIIGVPSYSVVRYENVYDNIDMVVTSQQQGLKYDFIVKPGGNPSQIRFRYNGAQRVSVSRDGKLQMKTPVGSVEEQQPYSYQGSKSNEVKNAYSVHNGVVSFKLGSYDATQTLMIDPTVVWSTYFGGDGTDTFEDIEIRSLDGVTVAVGRSNSTSIPAAGTPTNFLTGGAPATGAGLPTGGYDGLIAKFNNNNTLAWFTFFGGTQDEEINSVELEGTGAAGDPVSIYVMGSTQSKDANSTAQKFPMPVTTVPQSTHAPDATWDAFVACFTDAGLLSWDSYKGGGGQDHGLRISVRRKTGAGRIIVGTGSTTGGTPAFPTTTSSVGTPCPASLATTYQGGADDAFVFRWIDNGTSGATERWSLILGGQADDVGTALELDSQSNELVGGYTESVTNGSNPFPATGGAGIITTHFNSATGSAYDGYAGKLDTNGCIQQLGYLGGDGNDVVNDGALDNTTDQLYLMGTTLSDNFSGTAVLPPSGVGQKWRGNTVTTGDGGRDAFMTVFNSSTGPNSMVISCSTYHGGSADDVGTDADVLPNSVAAHQTTVLICGYTQSQANSPSNGGPNGGIPTSPGDNQCTVGASAIQGAHAGTNNNDDFFVACFSPTCCRLWSSFWGGSDNDQALGVSAEVIPLPIGPTSKDVVVVSGITYSDGTPPVGYPTANPGGGAFFQSAMATNGAPDAALLKFTFNADEKLPIELASFGASVAERSVQLDWRTASEDHNAGFVIERAELSTPYDKTDFQPIASYLTNSELTGMGTSPSGRSYLYTDNDASLRSDKIYVYRLVDVSEDGVRTPHQSISLRLNASEPTQDISPFRVDPIGPNPANESVSLRFSLQDADAVTVEIYSVDGKKLATPIEHKSYTAGSHTESIIVKDLVPGMYSAVVSTGNSTNVRTRQFVVVR